MIAYVVNRIMCQHEHNDGTQSYSTELVGVFSTPEKAEEASTHVWDCVMPVEMDENAPEETTVLGACYYPSDKRTPILKFDNPILSR